MPTYTYHCPVCGDYRDVRHGINEKPEYLCLCSKPARPMDRVITQPPGFQLKGAGWYRDGY